MRFLGLSLCCAAVLLQIASASKSYQTSADGLDLFNQLLGENAELSNVDPEEFRQKVEELVGAEIEDEGETDFLDNAYNRGIVQKFVQATLKLYKSKDVREDISNILKGSNGLFAYEDSYAIIDGISKNLNRLLLIPDNSNLLSKLMDIGTLVLMDQEVHKMADREITVIDKFLSDPLSQLTFVKAGNLLATVTEDESIFLKVQKILNQLNNYLTKTNLETMTDFFAKISQVTTGFVPEIRSFEDEDKPRSLKIH